MELDIRPKLGSLLHSTIVVTINQLCARLCELSCRANILTLLKSPV